MTEPSADFGIIVRKPGGPGLDDTVALSLRLDSEGQCGRFFDDRHGHG
jgi:hypothetical protein